MPDRAKITKGIPRRYQMFVDKIENLQPLASVVESGADAVQADVKDIGLGCNQFIEQLCDRFSIFSDGSLMNQMVTNWDDEYDAIRHICEEIIGNDIGLECVERAGRTVLRDLENGQSFEDIKTELRIRFEMQIFEARFIPSINANEEQKTLYQQSKPEIENLLRERHQGNKYLPITDVEEGNLIDWEFE